MTKSDFSRHYAPLTLHVKTSVLLTKIRSAGRIMEQTACTVTPWQVDLHALETNDLTSGLSSATFQVWTGSLSMP